jgi:hypothetical protein
MDFPAYAGTRENRLPEGVRCLQIFSCLGWAGYLSEGIEPVEQELSAAYNLILSDLAYDWNTEMTP